MSVRSRILLLSLVACCGVFAFSAMSVAEPDDAYGLIGDADGSGRIDIDDVVYLIAYIFTQGPYPSPICSGDPNQDGKCDIDDAVYLVAHIFSGGPPPVCLGSIVPKPVSSYCADGLHLLAPDDTIWVEWGFTGALAVGQYLADKLYPATGYDFPVLSVTYTPSSGIWLKAAGDSALLGDEGYELTVAPRLVTLEALTAEGAFRGIQTIRQLLPNEVEDSVIHTGPWSIPNCHIVDYPNFEWRGFLLDVARHLFTIDAIKQQIDLMAYFKMNVFHWHLTDDQGWRPEIDSFPLLNEIGSWRGDDNYGGYYTKEEMQEVVAYAAERYIEVVPEIEIPGHSTAAIVSYPPLMCHPPEENLVIPEVGGVFNTIFCAGQDSTLDFIKVVLDEIVEVFPSSMIHIGGDEAPKERWEVCPYCQTRISELGIVDEHELQMWMMKDLSWYLWDNHNRNTIGWSEGGACQEDMPPGSKGQWWLLGDDIATLAEQGYDVVNTYFGILYLDKFSCRLPHMYEYDITGGADPAYHHHILGAEAALWTEYVETEADLVDKVFPRIIAVAENVWTPDTLQNYDEFYQRLLHNLECLEYMGIDYGDMEE